MEVQFFCPRWGSEDIQWELFCKKAKDDGYDGIEYGVARDASIVELDKVWNEAAKSGLSIIAQHYDTMDADFSKHYDNYCSWLEKVSAYPVVKINSQTGKDYFKFDQNAQLIKAAENCGVQVLHETHRNKFSFAAHITKDYLEKIPTLQITLDASHWVCVAESYLEDQPAAMQLAIARTEHLHARVGYPEGPQVPDPRVKQWRHALEEHLAWWDKIAERKKQQNEVLTITTEFGPYPYMIHNPVTGVPLCSQWTVNLYMMDLLKKRYK
jgi:sugar phosphate isomerase/epimerase